MMSWAYQEQATMAHKAAGINKVNIRSSDNKKKTNTEPNDISPPIRITMPPVMAMRDLRVLSSPPQVVHFIPMQATPSPATDMIMLTIMRARVA